STWGIGASPAISFISMALPLGHPIVRPNRGPGKPAEPGPGWRARLQALKHVPRLLRLVWGTEPRYVTGILLLRVARSLVVLAVLPSLLGETHFASLGYSLLYSWTPERRQLDYLRYIGASDISAKELKLFGLSDFLVDRYDRLSRDFYEANKRLAVRRSL